jgi:acyl carrier protein
VTEAQHRLTRCFRAVFPELSSDDDAIRARQASVAGWDSLATVILAAAVEEEFEIQLDPEHIERLTSFDSYLNLLTDHVRAAAGVS